MCFCENEDCPYHELEYTDGENSIFVYKAVIPGYSNEFNKINLERYEEEGGLFLCSVCHNAVIKAAGAIHTSLVRRRRR